MRRMATMALGWVLLGMHGTAGAQAPTVTIGGEMRMRAEMRENSVTENGADYGIVLQRTRLHLTVGVNARVKAFVQFQDSRSWGEENATTVPLKATDLHQGYLDVTPMPKADLTIRLGRQAIFLGDHRLVGNGEWGNVARAFDGGRVMYKRGRGRVDLFATKLTETAPTANRSDDYFFGANFGVVEPRNTLEAYVLMLSQPGNRGGADNGKITTFGLRDEFRAGGLGGGGEIAIQTGDTPQEDIPPLRLKGRQSALALMGRINYTIPVTLRPRFGVEYAHASGSEHPGGSLNETFHNLFPTNHKFYGHMDYVGWRNIHDGMISLGVQPAARWQAGVDFHIFRLAEKGDAWYGDNGVVVRSPIRGTGVGSRDIGQEVDLYVNATFSASLSMWVGYSHFFSGTLVSPVRSARKDSDWGGAQVLITF